MSLQALLASFFPHTVVVEAARPSDADESLLFPEERLLLQPMAPIRRLEFTLGRNAARRALGRLGVVPAAIGRHPDERDPVWPAGMVGSITHTHGLAAAACARAEDMLSIGLDIERQGPLEPDVEREIGRSDEEFPLRGLVPPQVGWSKVLFVIKEASYKAWFPLTRTPLEFHAMQVAVDPEGCRFTATVDHPATALLGNAPWQIAGRMGWNAEIVAAGAVLRWVG